MRYIGNKTKLLPFIHRTIAKLGIEPGTAHDAFAGTSAVGRSLKALGWRIASSDIMEYSYVFQRAYVVASSQPTFLDLAAAEDDVQREFAKQGAKPSNRARALDVVSSYLTHNLRPETGFVAENFSPLGGRMYFTEENAARIDAVRRTIHEWRERGVISDDAFYLLLAALIEGADRVANTAGVYAAFIKSWQPNARHSLRLRVEPPLPGRRGSTAHHADATAVASRLGPIQLLYIDPPYNARQYSGYYHIPELIAKGWFEQKPLLRGKTGLFGGPETRSAWCSAPRAGEALASLVAASGALHVLVSYNSEGLLSADSIERTLREASIDGDVRCFRKTYRRYRADRDHDKRRYRGDGLQELLFHARLRSEGVGPPRRH